MRNLKDDGVFAAHVAEVVKALAHPVRLRMIAALVEADENVNDLASGLGIKPAIASQQLRILRMSGLVETSRVNGYARYKLAEPRLRELVRCLEGCTI